MAREEDQHDRREAAPVLNAAEWRSSSQHNHRVSLESLAPLSDDVLDGLPRRCRRS